MRFIKKTIKKIIKTIKKRARKLQKYLMLKVVYPRLYKKCAKQPVDERKIIFVEMRSPHLSDNFRLLHDKIMQNYDMDVKVHFMLDNIVTNEERIAKGKALLRDVATAKYIFIGDTSTVLGGVNLRPETKYIQLWHACGAFKRFGMSTAELIFGGSRQEQELYPGHKNYTMVSVSSPEIIWAYEEAMSLKQGVVQALGVSRTDIFYDDAVIKAAQEKLWQFMPESIGKKVILYAPTFRGRVLKAKAPDQLDVSLFKDNFSDEYVLLTKHHPFVKKLPVIEPENAGFAVDVTNDFSIDELLCVADICISDYSSVVYEYSLLERPMIFFAYDLDDYNDWRGFYYDYNELTPGPICQDNESMIDYIREIDTQFDKQKVADFREKFMCACDGRATQKIFDEVFGDEVDKFKRSLINE